MALSRAHLSGVRGRAERCGGFSLLEVMIALTLVGNPNDPNNPIMMDPGTGTPVPFIRRWEILNNTPEAGVIRMTVLVDYQNALGNTRTARIQSLKANL
jgi:prepilin-type N-terminal cleavage/methylation domain-containing protein